MSARNAQDHLQAQSIMVFSAQNMLLLKEHDSRIVLLPGESLENFGSKVLSIVKLEVISLVKKYINMSSFKLSAPLDECFNALKQSKPTI